VPLAEMPSFAPRSRSVGTHIAAYLERLIVLGELNPDDRLPSERDLAAELQVSRASLRDAMRELEGKRLIERKPGRGTVVLPPPPHASDLPGLLSGAERSLRDIAELRATVEPTIATLAAGRATEANVIELGSVLAQAVGGLTPGRSAELDQEFHLLLAQASQNPLLMSLSSVTRGWTSPSRLLSHSTGGARTLSHTGHREILEAVTRKDGEAAGAAMTRHLSDVAALTREGYQAQPPN
jgi:GntR family transcriptional repressor for pyruvate dehydrogenase complex